MSLPSMADDLVRLLKTMFPVRAEAPAVVLVGHSMVGLSLFAPKLIPRLHALARADLMLCGIDHPQGGAVVSEASNRIQQEVTTVTGVVVIDVVEGVPRNAPIAGSAPRAREVNLRGADSS